MSAPPAQATSIEHLNEETAAVLSLSDEERIRFLRIPPVVGYPRAKEAMAKLEDLLLHPTIHRMPNLLLTGASNNGKTVIARTFRDRRNHVATEEDSVRLPVVYVEAPPVPDERRFFSTILTKLNAPHKRNERPERLADQTKAIFKALKVGMLIVDEIQHLLAGTPARQRGFINVLKSFGSEMEIPIIGVGTGAALNATQGEDQIENRFQPFALPRWEMNEDFRRLLASFETRLPLRRPSYLIEDALRIKLLALCGGLIGELSSLLREAATRAIRTGEERISAKLIDSLDWTPPSERRQRAARMI